MPDHSFFSTKAAARSILPRQNSWLALCGILFSLRLLAAEAPRSDWVDPDTGHRIIRLSDRGRSGSLYFHQNSFTPEGDRLIFDTPSGIAAVDLTALGAKPPVVDIVVSNATALFAARK